MSRREAVGTAGTREAAEKKQRCGAVNEVVVVGGGAAGMMAAVWAARGGAHVTICEKNEKLGKKLFLTGKGRCNLTNAAPPEELFDSVVTNRKFMYSAFGSFDNQDVMCFFEELGLKLKTERGNRVFPLSDHSSDVIRTLERELKRLGVVILLNTPAEAVEVSRGEEETRVCGVRTAHGRHLGADKVLLATGGVSYPATGSTGDGHKMARELGHRVTELYPALVPLNVREDWCRQLQGLSLRNVRLTVRDGKKVLFQEFGEMLFTHYGVSGPLVLRASSVLAKRLAASVDGLLMECDLKPALSFEQLDQRLIREFEENRRKHFKNVLPALFPAKLVPVMAQLSGVDEEMCAGEITAKKRRAFAELIKHLPMTITKTGAFEEAIITQGGVSVKDVNPSTMESKLVRGLYFAGELLDVDAFTGGYNLQIAWATAFLAGNAASERV